MLASGEAAAYRRAGERSHGAGVLREIEAAHYARAFEILRGNSEAILHRQECEPATWIDGEKWVAASPETPENMASRPKAAIQQPRTGT